jgi:hypothetical protein
VCACAQGGCTPLWQAAYYGHARVVTLLLDAKASVDKADEVSWVMSRAADVIRWVCVCLCVFWEGEARTH